MNEKNRSMKFLIWQTEKIAIIGAVAPIIYVFLLNLIDGKLSLTEGIGEALPFVYVLFGAVVIVSYGFSLSKVIVPLAISMGSTRKEVVSASIFVNIFLVIQVLAMYSVVDLIYYKDFVGRLSLTFLVLGILIVVATFQNISVSIILSTHNMTAIVVITLVIALLCGFAGGFFVAFMDDFDISRISVANWWIVAAVIVFAVIAYIGSVYVFFRKTDKYQVMM